MVCIFIVFYCCFQHLFYHNVFLIIISQKFLVVTSRLAKSQLCLCPLHFIFVVADFKIWWG